MMSEPIEVLTITDWEHFIKVVNRFDVGPPLEVSYLFRGQARADWTLTPSLLRDIGIKKLNSKKVLAMEDAALREFKTQAHLYLPIGVIEKGTSLIGWWTLMQHYGAPTRLLDWTQSPFVAAYFAVDQKPNHDGAIWALHPHLIIQHLKETYQVEGSPASDNSLRNPGANPNHLYFITRLTETDRMRAQQMGFTVSAYVLADHGDVIVKAAQELKSKGVACCKLLIRQDLKPFFLRKLRQMNITARALFPGVDGLGRSIAELVRLGGAYESGKEEK